MSVNNKKYLDKQGLAKLWELINQHFELIDDHNLDKAEIEQQIADLREQFEQSTASDVAELQTKIDTLESKVDANKDATDEAIEAKAQELFQQIVDGAPEALDTLKEIAEYINSDDGRALDIIERIVELEKIMAISDEEIDEICSGIKRYIKAGTAEDFKAGLTGHNEVTLTENISLGSDVVTIPSDAKITIDLGGHDLVSTSNLFNVNGGELTLTGEGEVSTSKRAVIVGNGGKLVLDGPTIKSSTDVALNAYGANSEIVMESGEVDAQEFGVLVTSGASLTMNGGTVEAYDNAGLGGNGTRGQGDVNITINGGEIISNIQSNGYVACGIYMPNSGTLTINGGSITANGGAGIVCRGGETFINGGTITTTAHPTLEAGKVGDSRQVVTCAPVVYDKVSTYPAHESLAITIGVNAILNSGIDKDIEIISDEAEPKVTDLRA